MCFVYTSFTLDRPFTLNATMDKRIHINNFLIIGTPGAGKTTLLEKLIQRLPSKKKGFITREIRGSRGRTGFEIINDKLLQSYSKYAFVKIYNHRFDFGVEFQNSRSIYSFIHDVFKELFFA